MGFKYLNVSRDAGVERLTLARPDVRNAFNDVMVNELNKVIIGQREVIELILAAIFTRGHVLLVGVPGLAKTLMVSSIARIGSVMVHPPGSPARPYLQVNEQVTSSAATEDELPDQRRGL